MIKKLWQKILTAAGWIGSILLYLILSILIMGVISVLYNILTDSYTNYSSYDVLSGEKIYLQEEVDFYFSTGEDSYRIIEPEKEIESNSGEKITLKEFMLLESEIKSSDGILCEPKILDMKQQKIEFGYTIIGSDETEERTTIISKGIRLTIAAECAVDSKTQSGSYAIKLYAPGFEVIRIATESDIEFPSLLYTYDAKTTTLPISTLYVHSNKFEKYFFSFAHWIMYKRLGRFVALILVVVLVMLATPLLKKAGKRLGFKDKKFILKNPPTVEKRFGQGLAYTVTIGHETETMKNVSITLDLSAGGKDSFLNQASSFDLEDLRICSYETYVKNGKDIPLPKPESESEYIPNSFTRNENIVTWSPPNGIVPAGKIIMLKLQFLPKDDIEDKTKIIIRGYRTIGEDGKSIGLDYIIRK